MIWAMDAEGMERQKRRFGERIRNLRELRGWQLEDLAARVEKSPATISRIETGKQNLTMVDILMIAQALEIAPSVLFGQDKEVSYSEGVSTANLPATWPCLAPRWRKLRRCSGIGT